MNRNGLPDVRLSALPSDKSSLLESILPAIGAAIVGVSMIWAIFGSWKRSQFVECAGWGIIPGLLVLLARLWWTSKHPVAELDDSWDYLRHNVRLVVNGGLAAFVMLLVFWLLVLIGFFVWFYLIGFDGFGTGVGKAKGEPGVLVQRQHPIPFVPSRRS